MARSRNLRLGCSSGVASWLIAAAELFPVGSGIARGNTLEVLFEQVTDTNLASETTPTLSFDGITHVVIYTRNAFVAGVFQPGDIFYQRLTSQGVRMGPPVRVSNDLNDGTNDRFNDVSGNRVVYTAFDPGVSTLGLIRIYDMQDGSTLNLTRDASNTVREARIHGDTVAWVEGPVGSSWIQMVLLSHQSLEPITLSGAAATGVEVGSRFVVWEEVVGASLDIVAYDLEAEVTVDVASSAAMETHPATFDDWIVWDQTDGTGTSSIWARNMDSPGEPAFSIASATSPSQVRLPSIDGGLITYELGTTDNHDVYVYRLLDGSTHRVTNTSTNEILTNVFGPLVAFVDVATVSPFEHDVVVAHLTFVADPCAGAGGDADGDGTGDACEPPLANAGVDQSAHPGQTVVLDGSGSSHPAGMAISAYRWSVEAAPAGSTAVPAAPDAVTTAFTPDLPGDYFLTLVVTSETGIESVPDEVLVSTVNVPPVADAGPDVAVTLRGTRVTLDGSRSYDLDGDPLRWSWTLLQKPATSAAVLVDAGTERPYFVADVPGDYLVELVVFDPWSASAPDAVLVSFANLPPVASAGPNHSGLVGDPVIFDGSASSDPNGDPLSFRWSLVSAPAGSAAALADEVTPWARLVPDLPGTYVVSLVVHDGLVDSPAANATLMALSHATQASAEVHDAVSAINALGPVQLKNSNLRNALTNKLQAVLADMEAGYYADALAKLRSDVLGKTDGCAASGAPDANDWIRDCAGQGEVYLILLGAIALLEEIG